LQHVNRRTLHWKSKETQKEEEEEEEEEELKTDLHYWLSICIRL
jgi:hypothetical protein